MLRFASFTQSVTDQRKYFVVRAIKQLSDWTKICPVEVHNKKGTNFPQISSSCSVWLGWVDFSREGGFDLFFGGGGGFDKYLKELFLISLQFMGHMDVLSFISKGVNVYYPMCIVLVCLATYFSLGTRCLNCLGFQTFIIEDDLSAEYISEGKDIARRGMVHM